MLQGTDGKTAISSKLWYVKVNTTTTKTGSDRDETPDLPSAITLLANSTQTQLFAEYSKTHLVLVYRGEEQTGDQFLNKRKEVWQEK